MVESIVDDSEKNVDVVTESEGRHFIIFLLAVIALFYDIEVVVFQRVIVQGFYHVQLHEVDQLLSLLL